MNTPARRILLFIVLTTILSAAAFWVAVHGSLSPRLSVGLGMWAPGVAALVTIAVTGGRFGDIGWGPGPLRYLLIALLLPLVSSLPAYLITWASGLGGFDPTRWAAALPYGLSAAGPLSAALLLLSFGFVDKLSRALGEEIGWRGFLVPELVKTMTPLKASLIAGAIWAVWHFPSIIYGDYNADSVPIAVQVGLFAVGIIADGVVYGWLRLASGSVWPAALLHASFNLFTQSFFDQATVERPWTLWIVGEFGFGIPLLSVVIALIIVPRLRRAGRLSDRGGRRTAGVAMG